MKDYLEYNIEAIRDRQLYDLPNQQFSKFAIRQLTHKFFNSSVYQFHNSSLNHHKSINLPLRSSYP